MAWNLPSGVKGDTGGLFPPCNRDRIPRLESKGIMGRGPYPGVGVGRFLGHGLVDGSDGFGAAVVLEGMAFLIASRSRSASANCGHPMHPSTAPEIGPAHNQPALVITEVHEQGV